MAKCLIGGKNFGWVHIWGLDTEWLNHVGCMSLRTSGGVKSLWLKAFVVG